MIEYCNDIMDKIKEGIILTPEAFRIGEAAITGMLYEASASPAPGLVSPFSSGVHSDMNFFTFLRSTSSIAYAMYICAQIGIDYDKDILKRIRSVGIDAESIMLKATNGVNTQRGLLFAAGIVCAAAGCCVRKKIELSRDNISSECRNIAKNIVRDELESIGTKEKLTHGEKIYLNYGITGIRGEVENGLPSVINYGLPYYDKAIKHNSDVNKALVHSLLGIMTVVEDTVVINKASIEGLEYMRKEAKKAIELGSIFGPEGEEYIKGMEEKFITRRISPGGAADLLAISVMFYELENYKQ